MCRLFAYAGPEVNLAEPLTSGPSSLRSLAGRHGDGWGVATWHAAVTSPTVSKSPRSAADDPAFELASATRAPLLLAHIRRASHGPVGLANTHPFVHGAWAFAHNGTIHGLDRDKELASIEPRLRQLLAGDTDSEIAFLLFLQELLTHAGRLDVDLERGAAALATLARRLATLYPSDGHQPSRLNFLAGNGEGFIATRWGRDLAVREDNTSALLASQPLGAQDGWREVPERSIVVLRAGAVHASRLA